MAVTLKDIARSCGLAVSTVSNILNDNKDSFASERVKRNVKETARRMGYRKDYLSLSLRTKRTLSIGLCLDYIVNETRRYFVDAFVGAFNDKGYEVAITTHDMDPARAVDSIRFFEERYKEGIVLFTDFLKDLGPARKQLGGAIRSCRVKTLGIGSELRGVLPCLDIERDWAFRDCIRRFSRDGHRTVLAVYKTPADFRASFKLLGSTRFVHMPGVYTFAQFARQWPRVHRDNPGITAVFFRTDEIAIPALTYFARRGIRVPDDLCVSSFDHFRFSECTTPPLTTYDINFGQLGRWAFEELSGWIAGDTKVDRNVYRTIRPTFVQRQSHTRQRKAA